MAPKGKQGTKGQKQILQENVDTLAFYRNMIICTGVLYLICSTVLFSQIPTIDMVMVGLAAIVYLACYQFMSSMSTPKRNPDGSIIDEGCDLNIEGGIAEHVKDLIILTTACVALSIMSSYFWLLWLLAPLYAFRLLWKNILSPYFFQEAPPEPEVSEKKQRKMDRKMMRQR